MYFNEDEFACERTSDFYISGLEWARLVSEAQKAMVEQNKKLLETVEESETVEEPEKQDIIPENFYWGRLTEKSKVGSVKSSITEKPSFMQKVWGYLSVIDGCHIPHLGFTPPLAVFLENNVIYIYEDEKPIVNGVHIYEKTDHRIYKKYNTCLCVLDLSKETIYIDGIVYPMDKQTIRRAAVPNGSHIDIACDIKKCCSSYPHINGNIEYNIQYVRVREFRINSDRMRLKVHALPTFTNILVGPDRTTILAYVDIRQIGTHFTIEQYHPEWFYKQAGTKIGTDVFLGNHWMYRQTENGEHLYKWCEFPYDRVTYRVEADGKTISPYGTIGRVFERIINTDKERVKHSNTMPAKPTNEIKKLKREAEIATQRKNFCGQYVYDINDIVRRKNQRGC
ncbi:MAG: hypothetical protein IKP35_01640 [Alphaproteobacteria bacterium]|nr:hypothetical protein [Alphaproteobacteria bacterium]